MDSATSSPSDPQLSTDRRGSTAENHESQDRTGWVVVAVAVAVWVVAGIIVGRGPAVGALLAICLGGGAAVVATAGGLVRGGRTRRIGVAVVLGIAGAACALTAVHVDHRRDPVVTALAAQGATVRVVIRPTSDPRSITSGRWGARGGRVLADATMLDVSWRGSTWSPGTPILVAAGPQWAAVRLDAVYTVTGVLTRNRDPAAPQSAVLSVRSPPVAVSAPRWPWRAAEHIRSQLRRAVEPLPGPASGLLPSLAVGDTTDLPTDLAADMRVAGLSHLTVVSGANVTLICGGLVAVVAWFGGGPRRQAIAGAVALAALIIVARPDPSVLRAAAMGAVALVGLLIGRPGRALASLSLACVVLLLIDPWLSRSYGFALSAAATAGIVTLARPLAQRAPDRVPRIVAYPLAVTIAAQVSVTPILILLNPSVATYAVPANLLAAPVVAPTMVVTTLGAVVAIASPMIAGWLMWPAAGGAAWLALLSHSVAGLPGASLPWWSGGPGVAAAVLVGVVIVGGLRWGSGLLARVRRARRAVILAVPVVLVTGLIAMAPGGTLPGAAAWPPPQWSVIVCDVGQGEAVLIRAGPGAALVVDTGPDPDAMGRCLAGAGIRDVPLLVLTHFHADHVGGLAAALRQTTVGQVWHSPQPSPADTAGLIAESLTADAITSTAARTGDRFSVAGVTVEVLWPDHILDPVGAAAGDGTAINDASVVMRVDMPGLSLLCLGDVEFAAQTHLLSDQPERLDVDVTTIAHHGSGVQVPRLYALASPRAAIASAGADNDYGHPDPLTMAMVAATGAVVLSTATAGDVAVTVDTAGEVRIHTRH